jgi:hypothetical protein
MKAGRRDGRGECKARGWEREDVCVYVERAGDKTGTSEGSAEERPLRKAESGGVNGVKDVCGGERTRSGVRWRERGEDGCKGNVDVIGADETEREMGGMEGVKGGMEGVQ